MNTTLGPSPGAARHPLHSLRIAPSDQHWVVKSGETLLAASEKALIVEESRYRPVIYFPAQDVLLDSMSASDSVTTCPFKGEARYYAADLGGKRRDIAWQYPAVYDEVAALAGYIAFYSDRVDVTAENLQ